MDKINGANDKSATSGVENPKEEKQGREKPGGKPGGKGGEDEQCQEKRCVMH